MVPPFTIPDEAEVRLNLTVLVFAAAASMATAVIFGLLPALQTARRDVVEPLKAGGRTGSGRRESWLSGGLVVTEVALSLMLLISAALMMRSMLTVTRADYGVDTHGVLVARIPLDPNRYPTVERRAAFATEVVERLKNVATVESVASNSGYHPFGNLAAPVVVPGINDDRPVNVHSISTDYLNVFRIPLRRGRLLDETDLAARRMVAMVSESFVQRYLGGRDPLGAAFRIPRVTSPPVSMESDAFEIIGVAADTTGAFSREVRPEVYIPHTLSGLANFGVLLRVRAGDPAALVPTVRTVVNAIDKDQPITNAEPVDQTIARFVAAGPRFNVVLFGIFAALGLALVTVGLYGVMSNAVARRSREIGVRLALGATMGDVVRLVVGRGARLIGLGLLIGFAGGLASARYIGTLLRGVSPYDFPSMLIVAALLAAVGVLASWLPARRAGKIDPMGALRAE
jgi:putative ABC transport system permease protein